MLAQAPYPAYADNGLHLTNGELEAEIMATIEGLTWASAQGYIPVDDLGLLLHL
jgi:hypothetical protein